MTNDLIYFSPHSLGALELQELRSPFIDEYDPLLGVQSHHAFHHAAQNRSELMAIFLQLLDLIRQTFAHFVKGGGQEANFIFPINVHFVPEAAGGNALSAEGELMERPGDVSR